MNEMAIKSGYVLAVLVLLVWGLGAWSRAQSERARESGLYPPPGAGTDADVERLLSAGQKIGAIKLYREIHRVDLKTAKDAVDALGRAGGGGPREGTA